MEERENKREETASDAELQRLVEDFITQKQVLLIQVKRVCWARRNFCRRQENISINIIIPGNEKEKTFKII